MNNKDEMLEFRIVSTPNCPRLVFIGQTDITEYIADLSVSIVSDPLDVTTYGSTSSQFIMGKQQTVVRLELRDVRFVSSTTESAQDISSTVVDINLAGKRKFSL